MENLNNVSWIENQFQYLILQRTLRDVILHTAFIEQIAKIESNAVNFKGAITELELRKCRGETKYANSCLEEMDKLRGLRNDILHDIIKKQFSQQEIDDRRNEMHKYIVMIYDKSELIRGFFNEKYNFDPENKVVELVNRSIGGKFGGLQDS